MKYTHFVAVPMSSIPKDEYEAFKLFLREYCDALEERFGGQVFCAAFNTSNVDFDDPKLAYDADVQAIIDAQEFVMIYPPAVNSSVIFEAGYAVALQKPTTIFVADRKHLPFMMRHMDEANLTRDFVTIRVYRDTSDIMATIG